MPLCFMGLQAPALPTHHASCLCHASQPQVVLEPLPPRVRAAVDKHNAEALDMFLGEQLTLSSVRSYFL